MNASRPAVSWRDHTGPPRRPIRKGWTNVKDFLAPSLGLGACSFLRRGIAQQHLGPWVYLRGISAVGIPALVPLRDRIGGTHDGRSAGAGRTRLWGAALGYTVMLAALATVTLHGE